MTRKTSAQTVILGFLCLTMPALPAWYPTVPPATMPPHATLASKATSSVMVNASSAPSSAAQYVLTQLKSARHASLATPSPVKAYAFSATSAAVMPAAHSECVKTAHKSPPTLTPGLPATSARMLTVRPVLEITCALCALTPTLGQVRRVSAPHVL